MKKVVFLLFLCFVGGVCAFSDISLGPSTYHGWDDVIKPCYIYGNYTQDKVVFSPDSEDNRSLFRLRPFKLYDNGHGGVGFLLSNLTVKGYDCADGAVVFNCNDSNCFFENVSFVRNHVSGVGGVVYSLCGGDLVFVNCNFSANSADLGGAVLYNNGSANIKLVNCSFTKCDSVGAVINSEGSVNMSFDGCVFINNVGGIISGGDFCNVTFNGCVFDNNSCGVNVTGEECSVLLNNSCFRGNKGGCLRLGGGSLLVHNCSFNDNVVDGGGGALFVNSSHVDLFNDYFSGNSGFFAGACFLSGVVNVSYCNFTGNLAKDSQQSDGGAVFIGKNSNAWVMFNSFVGNYAFDKGAAVYSDGVCDIFVGNRVIGNKCLFRDGAAVHLLHMPLYYNNSFSDNVVRDVSWSV